MNRRNFRSIFPAFRLSILATAALLTLGHSYGKTYTITTNEDDDSLSCLRGAIFDATYNSPDVKNRFVFKIATSPKTITLSGTPLFLAPNKIYIIDATTQPGASAKKPIVTINAKSLKAGQAVFHLQAGTQKNVIKGFKIINFPFIGIFLDNNTKKNVIQYNWIGFETAKRTNESVRKGVFTVGIDIFGGSNNTISNNVISGVTSSIIIGYNSDKYPKWSPNNQFGQGPASVANYIGFNKLGVMPDGFTKVPFTGNAMYLGAGTQKTKIEGNTMASSALSLVEISHQTCTGNTFLRNFLGTDSTGSIALGSQGMGLNFYRYSPYNFVYSNTISANKLFGIGLGVPATIKGVTFEHANHETISGNNIGLNSTGTKVLPGQSFGIFCTDTKGAFQTYANTITKNNVSGNTRYGIYLSNTKSNFVNGNALGTTLTNKNANFGNGTYGLVLDNAFSNQVKGNFVKFNGFGNHPGEYGAGIFSFNGSSGNMLSGNVVTNNLHNDYHGF